MRNVGLLPQILRLRVEKKSITLVCLMFNIDAFNNVSKNIGYNFQNAYIKLGLLVYIIYIKTSVLDSSCGFSSKEGRL